MFYRSCSFSGHCIRLFRERMPGKVHATILKGIVGGFEFSFFQRNLKEFARKPTEMCLRVLKENNKSSLDNYSRQEQCIDHVPYYFSGLCGHSFSDNLSRNSCKKIDSMLPWVCSVIDQERRQNVVKTSVTRLSVARVPLTLFLPHFFVLCDLLLNMRHSKMESIS